MSFTRVRVGNKYIFNAVFLDRSVPIANGSLVEVINLPCAPKANTMGHCYVADPATGTFLAMVCCNSLTKPPKPPKT